MKITIPELSLVVLIGVSSGGKSTFARKHFLPTEILSSDFCRALVSDDENNQSVTKQAFEVLQFIASKRLTLGKLTVVDATNVQPEARKPLVELARKFHVLPVALVFNLPEKILLERHKMRVDRNFHERVIFQQSMQLRRSMRNLKAEGFRHIYELKSLEDIENAAIERQKLWNDLRHENGAFDVIGDVHGCYDELRELVGKLGYVVDDNRVSHVDNRKLVFVGDLVDRGEKSPEVLRFVMDNVRNGAAFCVMGNHDAKLLKFLQGRKVQQTHGLAGTIAQLEKETPKFRVEITKFLDDLRSHYVFDNGNLVVAHAGLREEMHGRTSGKVRDFALYGETTGETDEFGLPVRYDWAKDYKGRAVVAYGHTPTPNVEWLNNTICLDTGCVFGGKLTALRYPEREIVSVDARKVYYEPLKPLFVETVENLSAQQQNDETLDVADFVGKKIVETKIAGNVTIREENGIAALETMSRFAANPKWLIYLPPTMSPCETNQTENLLEHPNEAFDYFSKNDVTNLVCEEKYMGSRAVIIVCKDETVAKKRFGIVADEIGICYTRTGRRFFNDAKIERELLQIVQNAATKSNLWDELKTDWLILDCELMPWSAKAQELLRGQYAAVGAASRVSLSKAVEVLTQTANHNIEAETLLNRFRERQGLSEKYIAAYQNYCWQVDSINDLRIAPFHLLASEAETHFDKNHLWHIETLKKLCNADESKVLSAINFKTVDLKDVESKSDAVDWWLEMTQKGGEGMVVKPLDFIARGKRGVIQPAVK
ncbi:MAG: polynucleotide kinase-phosphatase, partial [Pyrinomonadaceae bacterium]|nr:polynucleotide kinase-phosphatase [Pyrinomonadaceae bacterium]